MKVKLLAAGAQDETTFSTPKVSLESVKCQCKCMAPSQ